MVIRSCKSLTNLKFFRNCAFGYITPLARLLLPAPSYDPEQKTNKLNFFPSMTQMSN